MRTRLKRASVSGLVTVLLLAAPAAAQTPVSIYVQAGSGGLAATGVGDSATDLRKALQSKRNLQLVESPAEAQVILRIDSRNERKDAGDTYTTANTSKDGKNTTVTTSQSTKTVKVMHATLLAGDFQMPLDVEDTVSWRFAAGTMANQVERWARENSARLVDRRASGPATLADTGPANGGPPSSGRATTASASIEPGMTEQDVLSALGAPNKRVSFGEKSMWTYRGMQVVFTSGRVSDVKF